MNAGEQAPPDPEPESTAALVPAGASSLFDAPSLRRGFGPDLRSSDSRITPGPDPGGDVDVRWPSSSVRLRGFVSRPPAPALRLPLPVPMLPLPACWRPAPTVTCRRSVLSCVPTPRHSTPCGRPTWSTTGDARGFRRDSGGFANQSSGMAQDHRTADEDRRGRGARPTAPPLADRSYRPPGRA